MGAGTEPRAVSREVSSSACGSGNPAAGGNLTAATVEGYGDGGPQVVSAGPGAVPNHALRLEVSILVGSSVDGQGKSAEREAHRDGGTGRGMDPNQGEVLLHEGKADDLQVDRRSGDGADDLQHTYSIQPV